jgi:ABC-2 type transport system permease protein
MRSAVLYRTSLRRTLIEFRRYAFDTITGLVMIYGFFLLIFFGAKVFGGGRTGFGDTISAVVVYFALWSLTVFALGVLTYELTQEAQQGTLEQVAMSPFGLARVLVARTFTGLVIYFTMMAGLLVAMMATTGRWLNLAPFSMLPIILLTIVGVIGLGFVLAGIAIVFKRVQQALQVWQLIVFGLIVAPVEQVPFTKYLPLTWGATLLRRVMVGGESFYSMPAGDVLLLVANSVFYFGLGIVIFKRFEAVARERGLLGHY